MIFLAFPIVFAIVISGINIFMYYTDSVGFLIDTLPLTLFLFLIIYCAIGLFNKKSIVLLNFWKMTSSIFAALFVLNNTVNINFIIDRIMLNTFSKDCSSQSIELSVGRFNVCKKMHSYSQYYIYIVYDESDLIMNGNKTFHENDNSQWRKQVIDIENHARRDPVSGWGIFGIAPFVAHHISDHFYRVYFF